MHIRWPLVHTGPACAGVHWRHITKWSQRCQWHWDFCLSFPSLYPPCHLNTLTADQPELSYTSRPFDMMMMHITSVSSCQLSLPCHGGCLLRKTARMQSKSKSKSNVALCITVYHRVDECLSSYNSSSRLLSCCCGCWLSWQRSPVWANWGSD